MVMKVKVNVVVAATKEVSSTMDLAVSAADTVAKIKDKVAAAQLVAFPDRDLIFQGNVLEDNKTISDCDVKESDSLDFVIKASEKSVMAQVVELLQARDLTCDELGLLYCYKHGVSLNQALKTVGRSEKFQEFLKKEKQFVVENGKVSLVREDTALKPFSATKEIQKILEDGGPGGMEITALASKFIQKFNVSISSVVGMRPAEFLEKEKDLFVISGRGFVTLKNAGAAAPAKAQPKTQKATEKPKTEKAAPRAAKEWPSSGYAQQQPEQAAAAASAGNSDQMYQDLHTKISGRSFHSKIAQALTGIADLVTEQCSFLNVDRVERGGSVGKGVAIATSADAELVFFVKGMPISGKWQLPLLKSVHALLSQHFAATTGHGVTDLELTADSVRMTVKDLLNVDLRFAPAFASYAETVAALGTQGTDGRKVLAAAFAKEGNQFVSKQTGQVKVTVRLLKWWRDQQSWTSKLGRPSNEILELVAIYSALQTKPTDQSQAIANAMSLMSRFDELRIVWSNFYKKEDIWTPLLSQRPLLMDPVNPFKNVADPQSFDPQELMSLAKSTHFFW